MKPVRMTLDDVHGLYAEGAPVPEHEAEAAFGWLWLRRELGAAVPGDLPDLPGVSESGRAVYALLADVVDWRHATPDAVGALCERLGWRDGEPTEMGESSWRWLARQWLVGPLMELVERKVVKPLGGGGLVMLRRPR